MKKYTVYCWENLKNSKKYIGYTSKNFLDRWKEHNKLAINGAATYFCRALRKYSAEDWNGSILFETTCKEIALEQEKYFIKIFNTLAPNGYNSTIGGTGGNTWHGHDTQLHKQRLSDATRGEKNPRYSGITDDVILQKAVEAFKENEKWFPSNWKKKQKECGLPKFLTKFRFKNFGGGKIGFFAALRIELKNLGYNDFNFMANKTEEHKEKLKKANIGKIWVTDRKNKKTFRTHPEVVNNETIFKGRNNYDKN